MNKKNTPYHPTPEDSEEKSKDSYSEKIKAAYLPQSKANYSPSEESIERANGLDSSSKNPASEFNIVDAISNS